MFYVRMLCIALILVTSVYSQETNPIDSSTCPDHIKTLFEKDMRDQAMTHEERFTIAYYFAAFKEYPAASKLKLSHADVSSINNLYASFKCRLRKRQKKELLDSEIQERLDYIKKSNVLLTPQQIHTIEDLQQKISSPSYLLLQPDSSPEDRKAKYYDEPQNAKERNAQSAYRYRQAQSYKIKIKRDLLNILEEIVARIPDEHDQFSMPFINDIHNLPPLSLEKEAHDLQISNFEDLAKPELIDSLLKQYDSHF